MASINCPKCQQKNPQDHHFCSNCGQILVGLCPRCQSVLAEDGNFCGNCGLGLTPRAQYLWLQDGDAAVQPLPKSPGSIDRSPDTPRIPSRPSDVESASPQPHLDQYIPRELRSKLMAARDRGGMEGERRIVTMLFCDVKGSTEAAGQLDPEDWTEIINGAFEYMIRPVYTYEGTVARLMGDGILAFFGAPIAHEDDPQRAVLTGLDIVAGIEPYKEKIREKWNFDIDVRVGINTGLVVVGAVGSDLRMEYTAMGDAINLAARMEQTAVPGTVQIAQDTYRHVAPLFDFEDLGEIEVKGKAAPVPAYRVLGRKKTASGIRGIEGLEAELVGRSDELNRLQSVVSDLERGIGRIVCLLGRPGLGKSRLIRELKKTNSENPSLNWIEISSLSYESNFPYGMFQQLIRKVNGLSAVDDPEQFWARIDERNAQFLEEDQQRIRRVLATLFGIPDPSGNSHLEGENFKRELYRAMRLIWQERFAGEPTMLVLDDLHWTDPASVDLLLHLMPTVENNPVVMLCAFRPDRTVPAYQIRQTADETYLHRYTEINLRPLSDEQSDELVNHLLSIADLPNSLRQLILERAGGNPFYVEEVVRTLIENGAVVAEDRTENGKVQRYWRATTQTASIDIPDNLQGLLMTRIDRLEDETRHIMQLASVIGRSFYHRVLTEIGCLDELEVESVDQQISRLVRLEMIQEAARVPDIEYKFSNPMMQEVAYQSILLKRRREFHRRVGEALETLFPDQRAELAPRLAYHYAEGQHADKAFEFYLHAGDNAFRLFALDEAQNNYVEAMKWSEKGNAEAAQLVRLYRRHGRTLELLMRMDDALVVYQSLEQLGEARDDDHLRMAGIADQAVLYSVTRTDQEASLMHSEAALALARRLGDRRTEARSLWSLQLANSWVSPDEAYEYGQEALVIARDLVAEPESGNEEKDILALILLDQSVPLIAIGRVDEAIENTLEAKDLFEEISNLPMVTTAGQRLGLAYKAVGKYQKAEEIYNEAVEIDLSIGNGGGLIGSSLGLMDIYPQIGDMQRFFEMLELLKSVVGRGGQVPKDIAKFFPVIPYFYMGAYERAFALADEVVAFNAKREVIWSNAFVVGLVRSYLEINDYETGRKLLAAVGTDLDADNYLTPLSAHLPQVMAELALSDGDWAQSFQIVDDYIEKARAKGMLSFLPEKLMLKGSILEADGQQEAAYDALREAYDLSKQENTRLFLWEICARLAAMEIEKGNQPEAKRLYQEARSAVDFIAANAGQEDLRNAFLAKPLVQKVLSNSGDKE